MEPGEEWKKASEATYKKRFEINEAATAAGLAAIEAKANAESQEAARLTGESELNPDEEERAGLLLEANDHEEKAEVLREAIQIFAIAYEAKAGKAPRTAGTKAAELAEFSKFLIVKRKQLHLSQVRLAELSGVTFPTINRIENGHHEPTTQTLRKISEALADEERRQEQRKKGNL